jgi:aconitase B
MGVDIPNVPNKRTGGICIGSKIAPIFFNTMEDSGQGLTVVHFSAQLEPFLTQKLSPKRPLISPDTPQSPSK